MSRAKAMYDTDTDQKDTLKDEFTEQENGATARNWPVQQQQRRDTEQERIKARQAMEQQLQL